MRLYNVSLNAQTIEAMMKGVETDGHLIVVAESEEQAREKAEFYLRLYCDDEAQIEKIHLWHDVIEVYGVIERE